MQSYEIAIILKDVKNPKKSYSCFCEIPDDCLNMSHLELEKSYGPHIIKALHDLLRHKPFRKGLENPKLIVSNQREGQ